MTPLHEILAAAEKAINDSYTHYFKNLSVGTTKIHDLEFLAEQLVKLQPYLIMTQASMTATMQRIIADDLKVSFMYNMTMLFRQRFALEEVDYARYIRHISDSLEVHAAHDDNYTIMPLEYRERIPDAGSNEEMLSNNRLLAMLVTTVLYFDADILVEANKAIAALGKEK